MRPSYLISALTDAIRWCCIIELVCITSREVIVQLKSWSNQPWITNVLDVMMCFCLHRIKPSKVRAEYLISSLKKTYFLNLLEYKKLLLSLIVRSSIQVAVRSYKLCIPTRLYSVNSPQVLSLSHVVVVCVIYSALGSMVASR